jgi:hypothetical protein
MGQYSFTTAQDDSGHPRVILSSPAALLLAWPDAFTAELPADLTLVLEQQGSGPIELAWAAGTVQDEYRSFTFKPFLPSTPCTLKARTGGDDVALFTELRIDDPDNHPVWDHTIAEWLTYPASDDTIVPQDDLPAEETQSGYGLSAEGDPWWCAVD